VSLTLLDLRTNPKLKRIPPELARYFLVLFSSFFKERNDFNGNLLILHADRHTRILMKKKRNIEKLFFTN
jgi:hypothetical protein